MSPLPFHPATSEDGQSQPPRLRVIGLDLSLTSSGMSDGQTHAVTQTSADDPLEYRLDRIVGRVTRFARGTDRWDQEASLAVIEGGAFSRGTQSAAAEHLAGLRLMVRHAMWAREIPFAVVTPTCLKMYTTGNGKAPKTLMVQGVRDRHGIDFTGVMVKDGRYDLADALALAAMGYARIGQPLNTQGPPAPRQSMLAVKWPEHMPNL